MRSMEMEYRVLSSTNHRTQLSHYKDVEIMAPLLGLRHLGNIMTWKRFLPYYATGRFSHYNDVIMSAMASEITSLTIVYSTVYSGADQRNIKAPRHWPLCGDFTGGRWIPVQKASNAENVSIWWRHHAIFVVVLYPKSCMINSWDVGDARRHGPHVTSP